jgi:hypothetical protein
MEPNSTSTGHTLGNMRFQTFSGMWHTLQAAAVAALLFAVCAYIPKLKYRAKLASLPTLGQANSGEKHRQNYLSSAKSIYKEGYQKVQLF